MSIVKDYYQRVDDEFGQTPDVNAFDVYLAPDVVFHFPEDVVTHGPDEYYEVAANALSDEVKAWHVLRDVSIDPNDENLVHVGYTEFAGQKPNGETWSLPGSATYRVIGDKIVEAWVRSNS
jgi:hypothetical protein